MSTHAVDNIPANEIIKESPNLPAIVKVIDMPKHYVDALHQHPWHQIIFPIRGILQTVAGQSKFLVPHTTAIFVPAGVKHESVSITKSTFIGLYINPKHGRDYDNELRSISVNALTKEIILKLGEECNKEQYDDHDKIVRLLAVLFDWINDDEPFPFQLLIPEDRRIKLIFDEMSENPALNTSLEEWGEQVGASERTLSRLFIKEFNTSYKLWRQHLRLVHSLELLETEQSIQSIAHAIGYQNDSSYIKAFKERFGSTPQQHRSQRNANFLEAG